MVKVCPSIMTRPVGAVKARLVMATVMTAVWVSPPAEVKVIEKVAEPVEAALAVIT